MFIGGHQQKEYQLYLWRVCKKGNKALAEFSIYLQQQIKNSGDIFGTEIVEYFIIISEHPTLSLTQKSAIIQIFEHIIYIIKLFQELKGYIPQLVGCIIKFFNDPSDKIRFNAISSIYNVFKFLGEECLFVYSRTFKELPCIVTDPSSEVRQAAAHLNHTMKTLLHDAILNHYDFDYNDFMNILTQNFILQHHLIKEFLIDWINTMVEIKEFETARYLPYFLKKLFIFLEDEDNNVKVKAQDCLNGLIDSFKMSFTCSKDQITKRYRCEDTQNILILLIKIVQESITFEVSSEIDIHVLNWLDSFTSFMMDQIQTTSEISQEGRKTISLKIIHEREEFFKIEKSLTEKKIRMKEKSKPFLIHIFIHIFKPLFKVLIQVMNLQNVDIQKAALKIHQKLQQAYPVLRVINRQIEEASIHLYTSIGNCRSYLKAQMITKWAVIFANNNNELINKQIDKFLMFIGEKILECQSRNLHKFFQSFTDSLFSKKTYFNKLIRTLLLQLSLKKCATENCILYEIIHMPNSSNNFLALAKEISEMQSIKHTKFLQRITDTLINFLITLPVLHELRENLRTAACNYNIQVIEEDQNNDLQPLLILTNCLIENRAALIGFCFFIRDYPTVSKILHILSIDEMIDSQFLFSLLKVSNLLLNTTMHQLFIDIEIENNFEARKSYLSLLMFLPINKTTNPLKNKLQKNWIIDEEDQLMEEYNVDLSCGKTVKWEIYQLYVKFYG